MSQLWANLNMSPWFAKKLILKLFHGSAGNTRGNLYREITSAGLIHKLRRDYHTDARCQWPMKPAPLYWKNHTFDLPSIVAFFQLNFHPLVFDTHHALAASSFTYRSFSLPTPDNRSYLTTTTTTLPGSAEHLRTHAHKQVSHGH